MAPADKKLNIPKDTSRDDLEATLAKLVETGAVQVEKVNAALDEIRSTIRQRANAASEVGLSVEQAPGDKLESKESLGPEKVAEMYNQAVSAALQVEERRRDELAPGVSWKKVPYEIRDQIIEEVKQVFDQQLRASLPVVERLGEGGQFNLIGPDEKNYYVLPGLPGEKGYSVSNGDFQHLFGVGVPQDWKLVLKPCIIPKDVLDDYPESKKNGNWMRQESHLFTPAVLR